MARLPARKTFGPEACAARKAQTLLHEARVHVDVDLAVPALGLPEGGAGLPEERDHAPHVGMAQYYMVYLDALGAEAAEGAIMDCLIGHRGSP